MTLIQKNDVNQIFAEQAPSIDKPAQFSNYPYGWGVTRPNNGKPTIKEFNFLQQRTDQNILWIHQNGAALPYDVNIEYADEAVVLKDGELQQLKDGQWNPTKDTDVIKAVESIADLIDIKNPKDGQSVFVNDTYRGGNFVFNQSKATINNSGTIFNGWVRVHFLTENLVEWFGARWDGSDATDAINLASIYSSNNKQKLNFGSSDRTYKVNTMKHTAGWQASAFLMTADMHWHGSGCKMIADNSATPYPVGDNRWYLRFFTAPVSKVAFANFSLTGIDFDTQFDKFNDDKHKMGVIITSSALINDVYIKNCNIYNASGTNAIGCFSDHLQTEIPKNWNITDCQFINNGSGGDDFSAIYLMCDKAEVKVDVLQRFDHPDKNRFCSNAIEIHGDDQNVHHCLVDKVAGGIIAGIKYTSIVRGTNINNNIINTYGAGITLWSGEDIHDKGHDDVTITSNTVRVIAYSTGGVRKGIGTVGFGGGARVVAVTNNTVICEDASNAITQSTPIHFNFTTAGRGYGWITTLNVSGNTTVGGQGIKILSTLQNRSYNNIVVKDNVISLQNHIGALTNIGLEVSLPIFSDSINNVSTIVRGNTVNSTVKSTTIGFHFSGYINTLSVDNTCDLGFAKYYFANQPSKFIDCENLNKGTNIHPSLTSLTANEFRFSLNLATLRTTTSSASIILATLPARTVIRSVSLLVKTAVTDASAPQVNIGTQVTQESFLKNINPLYTALSGFNDADLGVLLAGKTGAYLPNSENIKFNLNNADGLSDISGVIDISIKFDSV